jgi:hypothetical protein
MRVPWAANEKRAGAAPLAAASFAFISSFRIHPSAFNMTASGYPSDWLDDSFTFRVSAAQPK